MEMDTKHKKAPAIGKMLQLVSPPKYHLEYLLQLFIMRLSTFLLCFVLLSRNAMGMNKPDYTTCNMCRKEMKSETWTEHFVNGCPRTANWQNEPLGRVHVPAVSWCPLPVMSTRKLIPIQNVDIFSSQPVQNPHSDRRSVSPVRQAVSPRPRGIPVAESCPICGEGGTVGKVGFDSRTQFTQHIQSHVSIPKFSCCPLSIYGVTRLTPSEVGTRINALFPYAFSNSNIQTGLLW